MNKKRVKSYLTMGVFIGVIINFFLTLIIGVNDKEIYNYIVLGICSIIPIIAFSIPIIIELNNYGRINIKKGVIYLIIFIIISFSIGFGIEFLINKVFNIDICKIGRMGNTLYMIFISSTIGSILNNIYYTIIRK